MKTRRNFYPLLVLKNKLTKFINLLVFFMLNRYKICSKDQEDSPQALCEIESLFIQKKRTFLNCIENVDPK